MARELKNNGWISVPWEEYITKDGSHGAQWNAGWDDGTQSTFSIIINWQDGLQAETDLLGYAVFDAATDQLNRSLPVKHPYCPWMVAERILSAVPVKWEEKLQNWTSGFITTPANCPLSQYAYWALTIGFHVPKYRLLTDSQVDNLYGSPRQEWQRFMEVDPNPHVTELTREGGDWQWLDNGAAGVGAPTIGQELKASLNSSIYGAEWHVKWRRVPRRGLFAKGGLDVRFNANIVAAINCLHNGDSNLWDMPGNANSGVLRFVTPKATPIGSPFDPGIQGLQGTDYNTYYDVDLTFSEWRPPSGNVNYQGWNLAPNPGDNLWYLVGTTRNSAKRFLMADLTTIFELSTD